MKGREIKIKYANGGRRVENKIWDNYRFIVPARASHFRSKSKTVSIPEDLGCQYNWRICRSWCGILDLLKGRDLVPKGIGRAQWKKLGEKCIGAFLLGWHCLVIAIEPLFCIS
jgi:hypothetical protein